MADIEKVISRIARALEKSGLDHVIVGGVAVIFRGKPRTTTDIDLIVEHDRIKLRKFLDSLKTEQFEIMEGQVQLALEAKEQASIFDTVSIFRIDLKEAFTRDEIEVIADGQWSTINNTRIKIAIPAHILYGKIRYMGDIENIPDEELLESNDVQDFIAILHGNPAIDVNWLRTKVSKIGQQKSLDRLLDLARSLKKE